MTIRVFTAGHFPRSLGAIELPALPRAGETLLVRDPVGPVYFRVESVLHVEGGAPILMATLSEGIPFTGISAKESGLTDRGSLAPLPVYSPFDDEPPLGL